VQVVSLHLAYGLGRASLHRHDRIEFAALELFIGDALLDEGIDRLDAQPFEDRDRGDERSSVRQVDSDTLAVQIGEALDRRLATTCISSL
jgi:hypothetical protein